MNFSAVLLAGGKSTRMGRDKASLPYQGRMLWEHQIETLRESGAAEILISGPPHGVYADSGYTIISDASVNCGPIGGLYSTLAKAAHGHVLLLAVDLPHMTSGYMKCLWSKCLPGRGVAGFDEAYEPLTAFYPKELLPLLESHISKNEYSFQKLIAEAEALGLMATFPIAKEDLGFFYNWNAPQE
ncbi:MAG: hypothetical protein B9S32_03560 [Verrucomicrobia bacterium Tous-C9LFEB]|nr:MAG: hypothetical protein B9S32_03560 [Verrucomicrobia bacterium Tous-C9LFEB]